MANIFYIDGDFVEQAKATVPSTDLSVLRGYGVFDFTRTYGGQPFRLADHLARLRKSAQQIDLELPWSHDDLISITFQTIARNNHPESSVRIIVTGGDSEDFILPSGRPRLIVLVTPLKTPPEAYYTQGVKVVTCPFGRSMPTAKTLNYIPGIRAMKQATAAGAIEGIYVDADGNALEGTTTNLFAFFGDTLVTPEAEILPGITRSVVLKLAEELHPVELRSISVDALLRADEVFITSSNKEVVPVVQIDDILIGNGSPGKRTRQIMEQFKLFTTAPVDA